jgi:hypothetical protein
MERGLLEQKEFFETLKEFLKENGLDWSDTKKLVEVAVFQIEQERDTILRDAIAIKPIIPIEPVLEQIEEKPVSTAPVQPKKRVSTEEQIKQAIAAAREKKTE